MVGRKLEYALATVLTGADRKYQEGQTDADGHYVAASKDVAGLRLSARYNRHRRREVSISPSKDGKVDAAVVKELSNAHFAITGMFLKIAYSEPRNFQEGRDKHLAWAVLHPGDAERQARLM